MRMPEVSVIIPVYNVEKYLSQCLESVINQTMKEIEVICVNDGSTDTSGLILEDYARCDSRIKVIHKENTGYGNTMNVGLNATAGTYVSVIESDDFVEPDMLEKLYHAAIESDADITKANHYNYWAEKDEFCDWLKEFPKKQVINAMAYPKLLNKANTIWSCLYKRSFLSKHGILFHETPGAAYQDISFAMQGWLYAKKIYFIEDAVLHYRNDNPDSSMHNPNKVFCVFDEYEWLEEKFKKFWGEYPQLEGYFVATKYMDYLSHYYRVAAQYQYALLLRMAGSLDKDMQSGRLVEETFDSGVLESLLEIRGDVNKFFQRTGKEIHDLRLYVCKFSNEDIYQDAFAKKLTTFPQVVIYGAGKVGKRLAHALARKEVKIDCFAVTKRTTDTEYMGIPISELEELVDLADHCAIIIAVVEKNQYELYQNLKMYHFKHIFRVDAIVQGMLKYDQKFFT